MKATDETGQRLQDLENGIVSLCHIEDKLRRALRRGATIRETETIGRELRRIDSSIKKLMDEMLRVDIVYVSKHPDLRKLLPAGFRRPPVRFFSIAEA